MLPGIRQLSERDRAPKCHQPAAGHIVDACPTCWAESTGLPRVREPRPSQALLRNRHGRSGGRHPCGGVVRLRHVRMPDHLAEQLSPIPILALLRSSAPRCESGRASFATASTSCRSSLANPPRSTYSLRWTARCRSRRRTGTVRRHPFDSGAERPQQRASRPYFDGFPLPVQVPHAPLMPGVAGTRC